MNVYREINNSSERLLTWNIIKIIGKCSDSL